MESKTTEALNLLNFFSLSHNDPKLVWGIRLEPEQEQSLIEISELINQTQPTKYTLSQQRFPFIRLYEATIPEKNIHVTEDFFEVLDAEMTKFTIKWGTFETTNKHIILYTETSEYLQTLQLAIMTAISPLREGQWDHRYSLGQLDTIERTSVMRWGWPRGKDLHPFVLVGHGKKPFNVSQLDLEWIYTEMKATTIFMAREMEPGQFAILKQKNLT